MGRHDMRLQDAIREIFIKYHQVRAHVGIPLGQ